MFSRLQFKNKSALMYLVMLAGLYLAWVCSYSGTITSMLLNRELKGSQPSSGVHQSTLPIVLKKQAFYNSVVKSYHINAPDKEGRIWQVLSGIAIQHGADLIMEPAAAIESDSLQKKIETFQFCFKGTFAQMTKVLDSINSTQGIGRCSSFTLTKQKDMNKVSEKLLLKLRLSSVN